ncbi:MAG: Unknown protein [uncultured Aureispira sp.]|uniref:Outer membrane protein beta-barrel domain-containing protein n=1 Tax=uncultured Aureispira sp. TaxID=1331704 RepID=A0A6S6TXW0_9BACT|nr:MAG: Unknown protein [uncultured Aureispira sp.]
MLKKIAFLTIFLAQVVYVHAQGIQFGVHVDPFISFLDSDYSKIKGSGVNGGTALGVEMDYAFDATGNYSLTFGLDFSLNNGGTLLYEYGGILLPNSELDNRSSFRNYADLQPNSSSGIDMKAFTKINYRMNYIEIPVGLKLRTNELGGSYMRAFFHIPLIKIMIPVTAGAKIFSPDADAVGFYRDSSSTKYAVPEGTESIKEPNVWKDITPIQLSVGAGAGVEFTPNSDGGLRLYAGIYYHSGLIDMTGAFTGQTEFTSAKNVDNPDNSPSTSVNTQTRNPRNAMHNVALRIGVIF